MVKKEWFSVNISKEFGEKQIGLTLGNKTTNITKTIDYLKNRNFKITLTETKNSEDLSHKKLLFRYSNFSEKNCYTEFHGFDTTRDKIFSLIRKGQTMIEVNSDIKTKDGFFLRIFLIAFSRKRRNQVRKTSYVKTSQIRAIRRKMGEILVREGTRSEMKDFILKLISEKLVDEIGFIGSKIFPLQNVMIRKVKVLEKPKNTS